MRTRTSYLAAGLCAIMLLTLAGCGGGGSDSPATPPITVTGVASKGLISGGAVKIYALNSNGSQGSLLGTATTASNGSYSVNIGSYSGNVVVEVTGGTYTDEATGATGVANPGFKAAVANVTGNVSVAVTPLTDLAVQRAGLLTTANINAANQLAGQLLGGVDIVTTLPADATSNTSQTATQAQREYGLLLAALAQMANGSATTIPQLVSNLNSDLADNQLDTTGSALTNALNTFLASGNNHSGATTVSTSLDDTLMGLVSTPVSNGAPGTPTGLSATATSATQIDLAWNAPAGSPAAASYKIYRGGSLLKTATTVDSSDSGLTAATTYCYKVAAVSAAGNESAQSTEACATTLSGGNNNGGGNSDTWIIQPKVTTSNLYAAAYANGTFVAVGDNGVADDPIGTTILSSSDGVTWTRHIANTTVPLYGVAWSGSNFIAIGGAYVSATAWISPDGANWSSSTLPASTAQLNDIACSGSTCVAVGRDGTILTTSDGGSWTKRTSGTSLALNGVAWNGSLFVVVGSSDVATSSRIILTSPDGVTWTSRQNTAGAYLFSVTGHSGKSLAVGGNTLYGSTDGTTWSSQTSPVSGMFDGLKDIHWTGTSFLVVGSSGLYPSVNGTIHSSADGGSWRAVTSPTLSALNAVASSPTCNVAVGGGGYVVSTCGGTGGVTAAPTSLTVDSSSQYSVNLSWTAVSGASGYNVYRSTTSGFAISAANKINSGAVTISSYGDGVSPATTYYYRVTALNPYGESPASAEVSVTTPAVDLGPLNITVTIDTIVSGSTYATLPRAAVQYGSGAGPSTPVSDAVVTLQANNGPTTLHYVSGASYGNGQTDVFYVTPGDTITLSVTIGNLNITRTAVMPAAPQITAPLEGDSIDPTRPIIVNWSPFSLANQDAASKGLSLEVYNGTTWTAGTYIQDTTLTSYTLGANTLKATKNYSVTLYHYEYTSMTSGDNTFTAFSLKPGTRINITTP